MTINNILVLFIFSEMPDIFNLFSDVALTKDTIPYDTILVEDEHLVIEDMIIASDDIDLQTVVSDQQASTPDNVTGGIGVFMNDGSTPIHSLHSSFEAEDVEMFETLQDNMVLSERTSFEMEDFLPMQTGWFMSNVNNESRDTVAGQLAKLLSDCTLPDDHICTKFITNVVGYIHTMKYGTKLLKSQFKWDRDLVLFFRTLKRLGGKKVIRFLRGPGFLGKGRGAQYKEFDIAAFNIPIPSLETTYKQGSGYTTNSGTIRVYLNAALDLAVQNKVPRLVDSDSLCVIPVVLSSDATGVKPGCQRDVIQNQLIGATEVIDINYIKTNPKPDAHQLKQMLIREAAVGVVTTMDDKVKLPVSLDLQATSYTYDNLKEKVFLRSTEVQTCKGCINVASPEAVLTGDQCTISTCFDCTATGVVCEACLVKGYTSVSLRACDKCIEKGVQCIRFSVVCYCTDCEPRSKKLMDDTNSGKVRLPAPIKDMILVPDSVHIVKAINGSFSNWYLIFMGQRCNLSVIRTLREDDVYGPRLRKLLPLDVVRHRDRMNDLAPRKLAQKEVLDILEEVDYVVHPLVPERWRVFDENKEGVIKTPIAVCFGTISQLLVLDKHTSSIYALRLHYPVQVKQLYKDLNNSHDISYSDGLLFVGAEDGVYYIDHNKALSVNSNHMSSAAAKAYVIHNKIVPPARANTLGLIDFRREIKKWVDKNTPKNKVCRLTLDCVAPNVTAIEAVDRELLYVANITERTIMAISITQTGLELKGTALKVVDLDDTSIIVSILHQDNTLLLSNMGNHGGLLQMHLETHELTTLLHSGTPECGVIHGLAKVNDTIVFTDSFARKIKCMFPDGSTSTIAGDGNNQRSYGSSASFAQPTGVCAEGSSIFVVDSAVSSVALVTKVDGARLLLMQLGRLYDAMSIHVQTPDT